MAKFLTKILTVVFAGSFLTGALLADCSKKLTFGFPNLNTQYESGTPIRPVHVDLALVKIALDNSGCDYTFIEVPWKRILSSLEHGEIDGAINISRTEKRKQFGHYSLPYRQEVMGLIMRREDIDAFNPSTFSDIVNSKLVVGAHIGFWYGPDFAEAEKNDTNFQKRLLRASGEKSVYSWLQNQRVDIFLAEITLGQFILKINKVDHLLAIHPFVLNSDGIHVLLSKKSTSVDDVIKLNSSITDLRISQAYKGYIDVMTTQETTGPAYEKLIEVLNQR